MRIQIHNNSLTILVSIHLKTTFNRNGGPAKYMRLVKIDSNFLYFLSQVTLKLAMANRPAEWTNSQLNPTRLNPNRTNTTKLVKYCNQNIVCIKTCYFLFCFGGLLTQYLFWGCYIQNIYENGRTEFCCINICDNIVITSSSMVYISFR